MSRRKLLPLVAVLVIAFATATRADTVAHFKVFEVQNVCNVSGSEPITAGPPDLRFRMLISDGSADVLHGCPAGCVGDDDPNTLDAASADHCRYYSTCGTWDFADFEFTKVIPNRQPVNFVFFLIDDDTDADDQLGQHFILYPIHSLAATEWNRGESIPITQACGDLVEGSGWDNNFQLTYAIWYTDTDGPISMGSPLAWDNGGPAVVDDDQRLDFTWNAPDDPNTGISALAASLYEVGLPNRVWSQAIPTATTSLSICSSGCDATFTPLPGHQYSFQVSATNGAFPILDAVNRETTTSPLAFITVSNSVGVGNGGAALSASLLAPAPNPTRGGAQIAYSLPSEGPARLELVDLQGRTVDILADGVAGPGLHQVTWNGRDASGAQLKSGAYWLRLRFGNTHHLQRLMVVR